MLNFQLGATYCSMSKILSTFVDVSFFSPYLQRGIYVAGLREEIVASSEQVLDLMEFGECNLNFQRIQSFASSLKSLMEFYFVSKFILYFSAFGLIILNF